MCLAGTSRGVTGPRLADCGPLLPLCPPPPPAAHEGFSEPPLPARSLWLDSAAVRHAGCELGLPRPRGLRAGGTVPCWDFLSKPLKLGTFVLRCWGRLTILRRHVGIYVYIIPSLFLNRASVERGAAVITSACRNPAWLYLCSVLSVYSKFLQWKRAVFLVLKTAYLRGEEGPLTDVFRQYWPMQSDLKTGVVHLACPSHLPSA